MMKKPDSHDPRNMATPTHQCPQRPRRRSPNRNRPRNADSRKNENTPSMTSGWPMTPPVARENDAQFVPNWNSIGMPVIRDLSLSALPLDIHRDPARSEHAPLFELRGLRAPVECFQVRCVRF